MHTHTHTYITHIVCTLHADIKWVKDFVNGLHLPPLCPIMSVLAPPQWSLTQLRTKLTTCHVPCDHPQDAGPIWSLSAVLPTELHYPLNVFQPVHPWVLERLCCSGWTSISALDLWLGSSTWFLEGWWCSALHLPNLTLLQIPFSVTRDCFNLSYPL